LRERHGPKHHRRAATQEFDKQGDVMHWPGRGENNLFVAHDIIRKPVSGIMQTAAIKKLP
jgi:hypothetical protein